MFRNKNKTHVQASLLSLRKFNATLKRKKLRDYVDELDRLAEIDLQAMYADVAQIKTAFYAEKIKRSKV